MWISDAVDSGQIAVSRAAQHSGHSDAATHWLQTYYHEIPQEFRPDRSELAEFAAFFSTYLISSFDVRSRPGTRGTGPVTSCACDVCMRIVNAPHLQTKKLAARDKRRVNVLMTERIQALAVEHGLELDEKVAMQIATDKRTRRSAAYLTYAYWLIRRLSGESDGPAILGLWRLVAWDPRGGMRPGFELRLHDFQAAEVVILHAIQAACNIG